MTPYDIIKKIIGPIVSVGETNDDKRRLENLKETIELVNRLIDDIIGASRSKDLLEASRAKIGRSAFWFLSDLQNSLREEFTSYPSPDTEIAKHHARIDELESLLGEMKPGPYEYWDQKDNDLLAAECTGDGKGKLIAALPGLSSMKDEFRAIAFLLNSAPDMIRWARIGLNSTLTTPASDE